MVAPLPSNQQPIAMVGGNQPAYISVIWQRFFNSFLAAPAAPSQIPLTGSPFAYTAHASGCVMISGGTVSGVTLKRGTVTVTSGSNTVPVANGDVVTVTYSGSPTAYFVPS